MEDELVVDSTFAAPRQLVWEAWTELEHLKRWWGPKGFGVSAARLDFRPGGVFHYAIRSPKGHEMWGKFVYHEIIAPQYLTYTSSFSDQDGRLERNPMEPNWPLEIMNTLTLTEHNGITTVTLSAVPYSASETERCTFAEAHDAVRGGVMGTLSQLDDYLARLMIREYMGTPI